MDTTRITPQTPATPELEPDGPGPPRAVQGDAQRPDLKTPPSSPEADTEALQKGLDVLDRVKPY